MKNSQFAPILLSSFPALKLFLKIQYIFMNC